MRALACILCLVACDAGAKPEPAASPAKRPLPAAEQQVATTGFDLGYLPASSDVIVRVDVAALKKSKLWATYSSDVLKMVAPGFADCGDEPLAQLSSVEVGIPVDSEPNVYVLRGVARDRYLACFRTLSADRRPATSVTDKEATVHAPQQNVATIDGDIVTLESVSLVGYVRVLAFVDDHTMVVMRSTTSQQASMKESLPQALQAGAPLRKNASLADVIARAGTTAGVTVVSRPDSEALRRKTATLGTSLTYFYASIDLGAQLELRYAMAVGTADQAAQLANMMKAQLGTTQVQQLFDRFDTHVQDKTVTLDVTMGETKLAALAGMVRGMIPES